MKLSVYQTELSNRRNQDIFRKNISILFLTETTTLLHKKISLVQRVKTSKAK